MIPTIIGVLLGVIILIGLLARPGKWPREQHPSYFSTTSRGIKS